MMMKRRDLLKKLGRGSLALASLGLATSAHAGDLNAGAEAVANDYSWTLEGARALVGQQFWLNHRELGAISLTLEAANEQPAKEQSAPSTAGAPLVQQFTLLFAGPLSSAVGAAYYEMDHGQIGRFALYLIPSEQRSGKRLYRADFSLLLA